MNLSNLTAVLFLSIFILSCNSSSSHSQGSDENTIELNNGEKWMVNDEMKPYILDAEQILSQYESGDYKELAKQLKEKNSGLIKSCTMDGKSHDELHKWLHPHMQLIDGLAESENTEDANKIIADLQQSFQTYKTHFK